MLVILGLVSVVAASPLSSFTSTPGLWSILSPLQNAGIPAFYLGGNGLNNYIPSDLQDMLTCLSSTAGESDVQSVTRIMESIGPDVRAVVEKVRSISQMTEAGPVIREVAELIRQFKPLSEKPEFQEVEGCFSKLTFQSANGQALSSFFTGLKPTLGRLENLCTDDNRFNKDSIKAMQDLLEQIANLAGSFDAEAEEKFRYWIESGTKVMVRLQENEIFDLDSSECYELGNVYAVADTLDDIALLVEDGSLDFNFD